MLRLTTAKMNFLCLLGALALLGLPAFAQISPSDQILLLLKKSGYSIELHERTWLGRRRVIASKDGMKRELVFNPGTGEIMRDYVVSVPDIDVRSSDQQTATADPIPGTTVGTTVPTMEADPVAAAVQPPVTLEWSPALIGEGQ